MRLPALPQPNQNEVKKGKESLRKMIRSFIKSKISKKEKFARIPPRE